MTKHLRLVFGLLVIVSMVALPLIGCAQQPPAATPTTAAPAKAATPAAPAAATPKPAVTPASAAPKPAASVDKITVGMSQEPDTLLQDAGSMYASAVVRNALGTEAQNSGTAALVWRDDKNEIIPGIAESVPTFDNGGAKFVGEGADKHLEVTFKLRKNVKWHDGTQVTSKDVKFEWEVVMNPDFPIADRSQYQKIQSVETPDDYTVIFKFMSQNQAREAAKTGGLLKEPKEYADYKNQ
ncbi:MAG: ABC transporter substrate-binding protein, partial [Dehalococcoidales bacterium]|nr:ABC transporter substrate-binding protein [Dehalococcoidales bacterium]